MFYMLWLFCVILILDEKCCKLMSVMLLHTSLPLDDLYITSTFPLEMGKKIETLYYIYANFELQIINLPLGRIKFKREVLL